MARISKIYPALYGGESEQADELILDTQCRSMINCVPDVVLGIERRNGLEYVAKNILGLASKTFHTYDRGEGDEEYIFVSTGIPTAPLQIFTKAGIEKTVTYVDTVANIATYLSGRLKAITLQDRTFIANKDKTITQSTLVAPTTDYRDTAYYWLSRSSNDSNNMYRYAVYLNGTSYSTTSDDSETACSALASIINALSGFTSDSIGSVLRITSTSAFTFDSWDSWGDQASFGWRGEVNKLSDLPSDMPWDDVIVSIVGTDTNDFTDYFVKSTNGVWVETRDPLDLRGQFVNMPIYVDRTALGTFEVGFLDWEAPNIGDENTNPTPSFVNNKIQDIFFFKNRLGFASSDSIIMSEAGGYYNFYSKTALNVLDDDPIDIVQPSAQASKIYYVKPFQRALFIFTKDSQFETIYSGTFSPLTVGLELVSNYELDVSVEPKVSGNSLYFVSRTSNTKAQLREYIKNEDTLVNKGIDLTLNRPSLLPSINKIVTNISLGTTILYSEATKTTLYVYRETTEGDKRIQSALYRWEFGVNIEDIFMFDEELFITYEGVFNSFLLKLPILPTTEDDKEDTVDDIATTQQYTSYVTLPKWYPKLVDLKTPVDNVQIKKLYIYGDGTFDVDIERESYNTTITRTYVGGSTRDMSASIAGRTKDVNITIKSNDNKYFRITSLALKGLYRQSSKELK